MHVQHLITGHVFGMLRSIVLAQAPGQPKRRVKLRGPRRPAPDLKAQVSKRQSGRPGIRHLASQPGQLSLSPDIIPLRLQDGQAARRRHRNPKA